MVGTTFNLYNAQVRMSIDNRLDLAERYLYSKYRNEIEALNDQMSYMQNELTQQMEFIHSVKEIEANY